MIILRNKEFARKDYEGLNFIARRAKRKERSQLAKKLNEDRNRYNKMAIEEYEKEKARIKKRKEGLLKDVEDLNKTYDVNKSINRRLTREEKLADSARRSESAKVYNDLRVGYNDMLKSSKEATIKGRNSNYHVTEMINKLEKENIDDAIKQYNDRLNKKFKKIGKVALIATPIVAGTIYGIKKLRDHKKIKRRNDN